MTKPKGATKVVAVEGAIKMTYRSNTADHFLFDLEISRRFGGSQLVRWEISPVPENL